MKNRLFHTAIITAVTAATVLTLTACTGTPTPNTTPAVIGTMNQIIAPVTVNIQDLQGALIEIDKGNTINVIVDETETSNWKADITDSSIIEFIKGEKNKETVTNPSFKALTEGTTEVKMHNSINDVTFTVVVK